MSLPINSKLSPSEIARLAEQYIFGDHPDYDCPLTQQALSEATCLSIMDGEPVIDSREFADAGISVCGRHPHRRKLAFIPPAE